MRLSRYSIFTTKEVSRTAELTSHQLMLKAGLIRNVSSGIYSYLPLGYRILSKIISIVKEEMDRIGAEQILLPFVQPASLWKRSNRWEDYGEELLRFQDRKGGWFVLSPTHEELITQLAKELIISYKRLPVILYQIQIKFRDEIRPRGGVIRSREFLMKDAYSFSQSEKEMEEIYQQVRTVYERIFSRCHLKCKLVEAESGPMGGGISHEFIALAPAGEDKIVECKKCGYLAKLEVANSSPKSEDDKETTTHRCCRCGHPVSIKRGIEVGHLFQLGKRYSHALKAQFLNKEGKEDYFIMGCYGVGISRLPATIIEQSHDENGIIWPIEVAPFEVVVISTNERTLSISEEIYLNLQKTGLEVLLDDRETSAGVKFKDSDLIGIPFKVILGNTWLKEKKVEIKNRKDKGIERVVPDQISKKIMELIAYAK